MSEQAEGGPDRYARARPDEPEVRALLDALGQRDPPDLGGTMSLNLHLADHGAVVRIHPRFETTDRIRALRALRTSLADAGLTVCRPLPLLGDDVVDVGGRIAEAESFVVAAKPDATWSAYVWMYAAMGHLHRTLRVDASDVVLPTPEVATYATPDELRRWLNATSEAVAADHHASRLAADLAEMLEILEEQWVDPDRLPQHLIHGDIRLGNVATASDGEVAYFDFGFGALRPRIHELAYSLFWIVLRPDDRGRADRFDWGRVAELVRAYETAAGGPLTPLERRALAPCLASVPMYLAAIASSTPDPVDRIRQEVASLRIARWVLEHPDALEG